MNRNTKRLHTPPYNDERAWDECPLPKRDLRTGRHNVVSKTPSPTFSPTFDDGKMDPPVPTDFDTAPYDQMTARTQVISSEDTTSDGDIFTDPKKKKEDRGVVDLASSQSEFEKEFDEIARVANAHVAAIQSKKKTSTPLRVTSASKPPGVVRRKVIPIPPPRFFGTMTTTTTATTTNSVPPPVPPKSTSTSVSVLRSNPSEEKDLMVAPTPGPMHESARANRDRHLREQSWEKIQILSERRLRDFFSGPPSALPPQPMQRRGNFYHRARYVGYLGNRMPMGPGRPAGGGVAASRAPQPPAVDRESQDQEIRNTTNRGTRTSKSLYFFVNPRKEPPSTKRLPQTTESSLPGVSRDLPSLLFHEQDRARVFVDEDGDESSFVGFPGGFDPSGKAAYKNGKMGLLKFPSESTFFAPALTNCLRNICNFSNGRLAALLRNDEAIQKYNNHVDRHRLVREAIASGPSGPNVYDSLDSMSRLSIFVAASPGVIEPPGMDDVVPGDSDAGINRVLDAFSDLYNELYNGMLIVDMAGVLGFNLEADIFRGVAAHLNRVGFQSLSGGKSMPFIIVSRHRQSTVMEMHTSKADHIKLHGRAFHHGCFLRKSGSNPSLTILAQPIAAGGARATASTAIFLVNRKIRDLGEEVDPPQADEESW